MTSDDRQAIHDLVLRYHQALTDRNLEAALACTTGTQFWFTGNESDDPTNWTAVGYADAADLRRFLNGIVTDFEYANRIEFIHTSVQKGAALVVVRESGSFKAEDQETTWDGITNVWFVAEVEQEWRIVALFNRDLKTS